MNKSKSELIDATILIRLLRTKPTDVLLELKIKGGYDPKTKLWTDHNGIQYKSKSAMCKSYNIHPTTFTMRIERGHSIKYALTH